MALKICFISDSENYGGAEKYLEDLSFYLRKKTYECSFIVNEKNIGFQKNLSEIGMPVSFVAFGRYYDFKCQYSVAKILVRVKPNIVHINMPAPYCCSMVAGTARLCGIRNIISTEHLPMMKRWPKPGFVKTVTSICINKTIVVSHENKKPLETIHKIKPAKIEVVQNGVDLRKFSSRKFRDARFQLRRKYGFSKQDLVFGIIGRLTEQKGHTYAFEALAKIFRHAPEIKLLCVGDGELKKSLINYVDELGISEKVVFTGFQENMPAHYSCVDALLMPSLFEGLPLTLLEAMAMKKIAVASKINGIPEVIDDKINGFLMPKRDIGAIAEIMLKINREKSNLAFWGEMAYQKIKNHFSLDQMVNKTERIYQQL